MLESLSIPLKQCLFGFASAVKAEGLPIKTSQVCVSSWMHKLLERWKNCIQSKKFVFTNIICGDKMVIAISLTAEFDSYDSICDHFQFILRPGFELMYTWNML